MSFNLPKNHSLSLSYSKRINRPGFEQLNPFGNYSDPYNILTGNPRMKPAYTHAVELTHVKNIELKPQREIPPFSAASSLALRFIIVTLIMFLHATEPWTALGVRMLVLTT